jgi:hypothetical protein
MMSPAPRPAYCSFAGPSGNIFGVKLCTDATIRPNFYGFFFFYSFCYSLLFLLFFSILSYSSLLIFLILLIPAPPIAGSLTLTALLMIYRKLRENSGKKSAKVFHSIDSSTEQLQVALSTHMLLNLGLNKEKSLHTLPLRSVHFLSFPLQSLPLQTFRLVSLVSLITLLKLKE